MKKTFPLFLLLLLFNLACSEFEVLDEKLPDVSQLTINNISTQLPLVNIKVDQAAFDDMYNRFMEDVFVPASIDFFDHQKNLIVEDQKVTLEIKGAGSTRFDLKSIGVTFDESLDNVNYNILTPTNVLPNHSLDQLKTIRLRNSGNDFEVTMFKDMAYMQLAIEAQPDLELSYAGGPMHVFVNDEFLGLLNIRTESNKDGVAPLVGAAFDDFTLFRVDIKNGNLEYREGDLDYANKLIQAIKTEDTDVLWQMIDVDNFLDYVIYQDYIGNSDWPHNNSRAYSVSGGLLRFVLFDLDLATVRDKNHKLPELEYVTEDIAKIYRGLRQKNRKDFDVQVKERQKILYQKFSVDRFNAIVDDLAKAIEDEMPYQIAKYGQPESMLHWRRNVDLLKRDFAERDRLARKKYKLK